MFHPSNNIKVDLANQGFAIVENIYSPVEVEYILQCINQAPGAGDNFRKSGELFAIRRFLQEVLGVVDAIFNMKLQNLIKQEIGDQFFAVKSIYFDKPQHSNWYVSYHQDLTISVDKKVEIPGFGPWTKKQDQFSVQPPLRILQDIVTVRIHLDDTDADNGALKVVPGSHTKEIYRPETIDWSIESEALCSVPAGGVMLMKPLILHSSGRTKSANQRRVIHIELSSLELPDGLLWAERMEIGQKAIPAVRV